MTTKTTHPIRLSKAFTKAGVTLYARGRKVESFKNSELRDIESFASGWYGRPVSFREIPLKR
jgi:hypothetical protein